MGHTLHIKLSSDREDKNIEDKAKETFSLYHIALYCSKPKDYTFQVKFDMRIKQTGDKKYLGQRERGLKVLIMKEIRSFSST